MMQLIFTTRCVFLIDICLSSSILYVIYFVNLLVKHGMFGCVTGSGIETWSSILWGDVDCCTCWYMSLCRLPYQVKCEPFCLLWRPVILFLIDFYSVVCLRLHGFKRGGTTDIHVLGDCLTLDGVCCCFDFFVKWKVNNFVLLLFVILFLTLFLLWSLCMHTQLQKRRKHGHPCLGYDDVGM